MTGDRILELVEVTVFYLEMLAPSQRDVPMPRGGLTVHQAEAPSVPYYRCLYDAVGEDYHWLSRRKLPDEELAAILNDRRNELHVLHVDGSQAGFAELDRRQLNEIELVPIEYQCADCQRSFSISVTDDEMDTYLVSTHTEKCPSCGQKVGWGYVTCRQCGEDFVVELGHWHVHCNLAGGDCPSCGSRYESLCIC